MNAEYLLDAIGLLDDDLIQEAERYGQKKSRPHTGRWLALAASFAVVLALGYGATHIRMGGNAANNSGGASAPAGSNFAPAPGEAQASGESQGGAPNNNGGDPNAPVGNSGEDDWCAAIMVDGTLYWSTGTPVPGEPAEEVIRTVTGYTDAVPEEDGQTNFDRELITQYAMTDRGLVVLIDHEWILFDPVPPWEQ